MDVTLRQIKSFLAVSRCTSFTQAAQGLHLTQPALTAQIKHLELALALKLFDRDTRHVRLTHAGSVLVPTLQRIIGELEAAMAGARTAGSHQQETIRFACFPSFASTILPGAIVRFRQDHPLVSFDLRDVGAPHVVAMVRSEEVVCGVSHDEPKATDLRSIPLLKDELHVVYPRNHPIARIRRLTLKAVAKYSPILLNAEDNKSRAIVDSAFAAARTFVFPAIEVAYISSALALVQAGLGVAIVPSLALKLSRNLRSRPIDDVPLIRHISIIAKKTLPLSPAVEAFIDILVAESEAYKAQLAQLASKA